MNISPTLISGSSSLNGDSNGGPEATRSSSTFQSLLGGHLILDPLGVAGEPRDENARRGIESPFADHQVRGEVPGCPVTAQRGVIGADATHRGDESGTLGLGNCHM